MGLAEWYAVIGFAVMAIAVLEHMSQRLPVQLGVAVAAFVLWPLVLPMAAWRAGKIIRHRRRQDEDG